MYKFIKFNILAYSVIFPKGDIYFLCNMKPIFDFKDDILIIHSFELITPDEQIAFTASISQALPTLIKTIIYRSEYYKSLEHQALHKFIYKYRNTTFQFDYSKLFIEPIK